MALPTDTFTTYTAVGQREDLSDVIYDISPTETPFVSNLARVTASARLHDWQMDNLAAANTANAALEGDDHLQVAITPTQLLRNYTQIFRKDIAVTGTMRAVDTAGRADELDYQTAKIGREVKRDIEAVFTQEHAATAGGTLSARAMTGVEAWLGSTSTNGIQYAYTSQGGAANATSPGFASGTGLVTAPTDGTTTAAFGETALKGVISQSWINGGEPRVVMVGPFNKAAASGFAGIATLQKDVPGNTQGVIVGAADIYVSDFGVHTIIPNRFNRDRTALVLDMTLWANAELRAMQTVPIAKTGDSEKVMLLTETTLECRNPFGSGKVSELTTA
jgi:hypothetical protein